MAGFIDLHCHWVAAIDDGARTFEQGLEMLRRLPTRSASDSSFSFMRPACESATNTTPSTPVSTSLRVAS